MEKDEIKENGVRGSKRKWSKRKQRKMEKLQRKEI